MTKYKMAIKLKLTGGYFYQNNQTIRYLKSLVTDNFNLIDAYKLYTKQNKDMLEKVQKLEYRLDELTVQEKREAYHLIAKSFEPKTTYINVKTLFECSFNTREVLMKRSTYLKYEHMLKLKIKETKC